MIMLQLTVVVHVFIVVHKLAKFAAAATAAMVMVQMVVVVMVVKMMVIIVVGIGNVVVDAILRRHIVLVELLPVTIIGFGEIGEHQELVLLLAPYVIGKAGVRVVDAHRSAQIALRVLDPFQLVHAQL